MAQYQITSPDGKAFVVNAPDGATQDQVLEFAKSQWEKGSKSNPVAEAPKPEFDDPGFMGSTLIGAGRTFDRIGKGMQQLYYGARGNEKELASLKAKAEEDDRAYKPLQEARPFATGIGESLPSMVIPGGGAATWTGNALRMGLSAAIPAALEYGDAGDRLLKATIAGVTGAAIPAAGALFKSAKTFAEPLYEGGRNSIVGRTLNRIAGDDASNVIQRLKSAQPLVPGSMPTAAQVAENGGIAAMERSAAGANPSAFAQRKMEQASARLNALRGIAGDDAAIAAQATAREAATKGSYTQAKNAAYVVDDKLQNLLDRPLVKKAMERAKGIAENDSRQFGFTTTTSAPFRGVGGGQPQVKTQVTGQGLQDLKMALDDMLRDPTSGIVGTEAKQAQNLRGQVVDWMEGANPEFKAARTTYAAMSKPINQMKVGQELLTKLEPALADFGALGQETGATFARQLRKADQMVKTATGFKGAGSLDELMGPQNMGTINSIAQDLARKSNAENLGRGVGSDTFQKLAMQNIAEQSGMPRLVGGLLDFPVVSRATKWVYRDSDEAAQKVISEAMLNPAKAAQLMEQVDKGLLQDSPKLKQALLQTGMRIGGLLGMTATQP
jgi:hypothetical protein